MANTSHTSEYTLWHAVPLNISSKKVASLCMLASVPLSMLVASSFLQLQLQWCGRCAIFRCFHTVSVYPNLSEQVWARRLSWA